MTSPDCSWCKVTRSSPRCLTDPIVEVIDLLQHQTGEGPCLDAIAQGVMVYGDDLSTDPRWPKFGPLAGENGMRSALALPLTANGALGAVNLYATYSCRLRRGRQSQGRDSVLVGQCRSHRGPLVRRRGTAHRQPALGPEQSRDHRAGARHSDGAGTDRRRIRLSTSCGGPRST